MEEEVLKGPMMEMKDGLMTDTRPLRMNSNMSRLLTLGSLISASSSSDCLENVILTTLISSSSLRPQPNDDREVQGTQISQPLWIIFQLKHEKVYFGVQFEGSWQ